MSSEPPAALTEPALLPVGTHSLRVLVADENRESNDHLAAMIHSWGHDVQAACEAASALVVASAYRPDVVLIDLQLPEPDGGRLAQALRQQPQLKETVLIVKTAWAEQERRLFHQRSAFTLFDSWLSSPLIPRS